MKKKIQPKDQTKELAKARYEFLKRNSEEYRKHNDAAFTQFRTYCKKHGIPDQEAEEAIRDSLVRPAAKDASLSLLDSWVKVMHSLPKHPLMYSPEEKASLWREQILKNAKGILNEIIFPDPSREMIVTIDLERSKESILSEFIEILNERHNEHRKVKKTVFVFDENGKFTGKFLNDRTDRIKWLSVYPQLIEVWDLYEAAGKTPAIQSFKYIAKKVDRPLSTVKEQWYRAFELIYDRKYDGEARYATEESRKAADEMCVKCPKMAECYKERGGLMNHIPCKAYLKVVGIERGGVEYDDNRYYGDQ